MINSCVGKKDTLIILGDIGNIECVRKLRAGFKVLIMGNHDVGITNYQRKHVCEMFNVNKYTKQEAMADMAKRFPEWRISARSSVNEQWTVFADNLLFDEVYEGALIVGEKLILSHEPIVGLTWAMNLHGHVHDKRAKTDAYHINCCSDVIGYEPINFNQWLKEGHTARIQTIHRETIDNATKRKAKRGGKKIGK